MYTQAHSECACVRMTCTPESERIVLGVIPRVLSSLFSETESLTGLELAGVAALFGHHAPASCLVPPLQF